VRLPRIVVLITLILALRPARIDNGNEHNNEDESGTQDKSNKIVSNWH
jgi:hypothetical protein